MARSFRSRYLLPGLRVGVTALVLALGGAGCTPPSEDELMAKAEAAIAAGDEASARIYLMNIVQRNEANVRAQVRLSDLDLDAGNPGTAELGYRRAAKFNANDVGLRLGQAQAIAQQADATVQHANAEESVAKQKEKRFKEALDLLEPDVAATPADRARILGLRGTLRMKNGDLQGARESLDEALQLTPDDPDRIVEMAQLEVRADRPAEADRRIAQALALEPDHARALLIRGSRESARKQFTAAEATFRRAADIANTRHMKQVRLSALMALAEVQLVRQRTDEARKTIGLLNGIAKDVPQVRFLRASLDAQTGDDKKAIEELLLILTGDRDNLPARRLLGFTYAKTSQWNMAQSQLAAVADAHPDDAEVREALVAVRAQQGNSIDGGLMPGARRKPDGERKQSLTLAAAQELAYGRPEEALEYFRAAETEYPQDAQLALGTALALINSEQYDEAIEKLQADTGPVTAPARYSLLVSAWLRKGDKARALAVTSDLVAKNPGQAWAHDLHAAVLLTNGRTPDAMASLQRALAIDAGDAFALGGLVPLELKAGNIAAAEALLAHAPADSAQLLRGMVALQKGDTRTARSLGEAAVKQNPGSADGHNLLGLAELAAGTPVAAIGHFESAQLLAPRVPLYPLNLAMAYLATGQVDAATESAAQARALHADPEGLAEIDVRLLLAARDLAGAEKALAHVTPKEPESTTRLLLVAELRQAQGDLPGAADALSTAYANDPSKALAIKTALARQAAGRSDMKAPLQEWQQRAGADADVLFTGGSIDYAMGNYAAAQKQFEEAVRIDPGHVQALNNLAWIYNEAHDRRAPDFAERAYRAAPDDASVLDTVGWVTLSAGKSAAALEILSKAAGLAPDNPEIQYHLAMALIGNDRRTEARQILEALLRSPDGFPSRPAATEQLERLARS